MRRQLARLACCMLFLSSAQAEENTVILNCNISGKKVLKAGSGSSASLLDEEQKTFAENDEINLSAKTWRVIGSSDPPAKMASVSPQELVLSDSSFGSTTSHWSINRRTGVYNLRQTHFDSLRNETVEVTLIGSCKTSASDGPTSF